MSSRYSGIERRRYPRTDVGDGADCRLDMRTRVRLIDISQSGALLAADVRLPVGASAQLMTGVGGGPFTPVVAVRRCVGRSESGQPAVGLGATFLEMDAQSRQSLEAFLQRAAK